MSRGVSTVWKRVLAARRDRDIGDLTDALDLAHDIAGDHGEPCFVTFGRAERALARIARRLRRRAARTPTGPRRR